MSLKKTVHRLFTAAAALVMAFAMVTPAFAASGVNDNSGKITIDGALSGKTYTAYEMLTLESYNTASGAYSYKIANGWNDFFTGEGAGATYVNVDNSGYVTWKNGAPENPDTVQAFAKAALDYAQDKSNGVTAIPSDISAGTEVTFSNLNLGYYLVDTSTGSLCSVGTTVGEENNEVIVQEKNSEPTVTKEVVAPDEGENAPSVGDNVTFKVTVTAQKGAQNYVLHDKMTSGLTFIPDSVVASVEGAGQITDDDWDVVTTDLGDSCTFHIEFDQVYLDKITTSTSITFTYEAEITEDAVDVDSMTNTATLSYGNGHSTSVSTSTSVYQFGLFKSDNADKPLSGAKFELYNAESGGEKIPLVMTSENAYRVASADERDGDDFVSAVIETPASGVVTVDGLGTGTYWLEETAAPDGYNKLASRREVVISDADNNVQFDKGVYQDGGVHVINQAGSILPTTGGMGTTALYAVGAVLVVGAGVTLVVRRRAHHEA